MTSVSAGHIILTPTQPLGRRWPQRGSNRLSYRAPQKKKEKKKKKEEKKKKKKEKKKKEEKKKKKLFFLSAKQRSDFWRVKNKD